MLHLINLGVHFGDRTLFSGLDLAIGVKDRIGLVGRNGAGKSTLLKIIAGIQRPSEGQVSSPKDYRIGYLPQEMEHEDQATVLEVAMQAFEEVNAVERRLERLTEEVSTRTDYESESYAQLIQDLSDANERLDALGASNTEEQAHRILQGLGFLQTDVNRVMGEFSGGWKMRGELAKLLLMQPDLLLLDEPTNHLDIESIEWLEAFLLHHPGAIMLISHDRVFLDTLTKRTVELGGVKLYDFKGAYSAYQVWREEERERQEQAAKNQQKYIQDTEQLINKFRAKKNKAAFAQGLMKKLDRLERIEVDAAENMQIKFRFPPAPRSGKVIFEAKTVKKAFGDLVVFEGLDFIMARQEKVALVGKNGAGKTTLTRMLLRREACTAGELNIGHNVDIGYYAQNQTDELHGDLTVLETLEEVAVGDVRKHLRALLGAFLFSGEDVDKKVKVLSGGEKARLALCKLLLHPYNVLILDEPTNHLDLKSKAVLKEALQAFDGSLVVVSHDRDFLSEMTQWVYEVTPRGLTQYIGDIKAFLHEKHATSITAYEANKTVKVSQTSRRDAGTAPNQERSQGGSVKDGVDGTTGEDYKARKQREKDVRKAKNAVDRLEKKVIELEEKLARHNQAMAETDPSDRSKIAELAYAYDAIQQDMQDHINQWEKALETLEGLETES
ncbi:MAG: ATP-binding cassette domain-containing protein [Bacteroidetes bacterium]|nr:ATP-binding cassette domain-containing protein [Bacteroidota bacterium]MDA0903328.1 ATP-binding cassette domain-containing protein [Bacteroidota bacterium]MDA1242294.1 ATP-binding cassette domain-containing protein [Bacteroidota bacterium]